MLSFRFAVLIHIQCPSLCLSFSLAFCFLLVDIHGAFCVVSSSWIFVYEFLQLPAPRVRERQRRGKSAQLVPSSGKFKPTWIYLRSLSLTAEMSSFLTATWVDWLPDRAKEFNSPLINTYFKRHFEQRKVGNNFPLLPHTIPWWMQQYFQPRFELFSLVLKGLTNEQIKLSEPQLNSKKKGINDNETKAKRERKAHKKWK